MTPPTGQRIDRVDRSILGGTSLGSCSTGNVYFNTVIDGVSGASVRALARRRVVPARSPAIARASTAVTLPTGPRRPTTKTC